MKKIIAILLILFPLCIYAQDTIRIKLQGGGTNASVWTTSGNTGTNPGSNFIGTIDSVGLMFKVNNVQSGYIDIRNNNTSFGQSTLSANLTGKQNTVIGSNAGINNTTGFQNTYLGSNTGLGIASGNYNTILGANVTGLNATLSNNIIIADGQGNRRINVDSAGNVAIGTTDARGYKLAVNGNSIFNQVKVKLYSDWPDYVFGKNYKLPSLKEVELFLQTNNHLPDVPSANDVEKDGIDLGDNQAVLLKKVEELTLYLIKQNKKAEQQQQQIEKLQQQMIELKSALLKKH